SIGSSRARLRRARRRDPRAPRPRTTSRSNRWRWPLGPGRGFHGLLHDQFQPAVRPHRFIEVGSSSPKVVPGSHSVSGARVALAASPNGRLWVAWYDGGKKVVHALRTNTTGTSFGVIRTIKPPSHTDFSTRS